MKDPEYNSRGRTISKGSLGGGPRDFEGLLGPCLEESILWTLGVGPIGEQKPGMSPVRTTRHKTWAKVSDI